MFRDRSHAGDALAAELAKRRYEAPIVLALPRGGVAVAAPVARALAAPLDPLIVRKVGAPGNPELAVAAIVDGNPPDIVVNREIIEAYGLGEAELQHLVALERPELERRREAYRIRRSPLSVRGKTAIVVDDGVATGTTAKAALRALRRRGPAKIVLAIPVAPPDTLAELAGEVDEIVCLSQPAHFLALGQHYLAFPQLTDAEVVETLRAEQAALRGRAADGGL